MIQETAAVVHDTVRAASDNGGTGFGAIITAVIALVTAVAGYFGGKAKGKNDALQGTSKRL